MSYEHMVLIDFKVVGEFIRSCLPRQNPGWMLTYLLYLLTYLLYLFIRIDARVVLGYSAAHISRSDLLIPTCFCMLQLYSRVIS